MNTTENNKLIAEFMQLEKNDLSSKNFELIGYAKDENSVFLRPKNLKYHSDLNWLIEVVEKIKSLNNWFEITTGVTNNCKIGEFGYEEPDVDIDADDLLEAIYNCCVEFIKRYNKQQ